MDQELIQLFFSLLRTAISGEKISEEDRFLCSSDRFQSLLKTASKHDIAHLLVFGLTQNKNYYWPTRKDKPVYCGVIDDEEFTAYLYPTEAHLWEILEDPTGMAHNTIYGSGKGKLSIKEHEEMIAKFSDVLKDK